ncbi:uncharacterized protein LOC143471209 [Clavelina lepadiformis]|uniref:uncharacterized protein LOC143471209 n=1 Tax=Clavelina lepadiformis TaxID=159417 RepID=UPI004043817D
MNAQSEEKFDPNQALHDVYVAKLTQEDESDDALSRIKENLSERDSGDLNQATKGISQPQSHRNDSEHLLRVGGNTFEFHHIDPEDQQEAEEPSRKSIFEVHHKHLNATGNQRPTDRDGENKNKEKEFDLSSKLDHLLPNNSQFQVIAEPPHKDEQDHNKSGRDITTGSSATAKKPKQGRRLFDYSDPTYIEKSRRARRRKVSEVDIEIGSRLSRFVSNPYEGCADKFAGGRPRSKFVQGTIERPKSARKHSPLSGNSTNNFYQDKIRSDSSERAYLTEFNGQDIYKYLNSKRGFRRRSSSASPPRSLLSSVIKQHLLKRGSYSQAPSPEDSPPTSQGPSSPIVNRYQKTTFTTILNSDGKEVDHFSHFQKGVEFTSKGSLPDIHNKDKAPIKKPPKDIEYLSSSLPSLFLSKHRRRADTFTSLESLQQSDKRSLNNMSKSGVQTADKGTSSPKMSPPGSLRTHVLLNTSLPCGSPTFQRAMKGFKPDEDEDTKDTKKNGIKLQEIKPKKSSKNSRTKTRVSSASGRRVTYKKSPLATPSPKFYHRISFREPSPDDFSETLSEIRDQLGNLDVREPNLDAIPLKSILKNRRRSIDDLDVGTKKGLAMYLKSKQKENNFSGKAGFS